MGKSGYILDKMGILRHVPHNTKKITSKNKNRTKMIKSSKIQNRKCR